MARYLSSERADLCGAELARIAEYAECYRARLHDVSWFMRVLNESIARQAKPKMTVLGASGRVASKARHCSTNRRCWP